MLLEAYNITLSDFSTGLLETLALPQLGHFLRQ